MGALQLQNLPFRCHRSLLPLGLRPLGHVGSGAEGWDRWGGAGMPVFLTLRGRRCPLLLAQLRERAERALPSSP